MKKVSIIIPCYNVESTIDTCMDSLLHQTIGIENLELIFVNDASTDNSLTKMYEWEQKFTDSMMVINCTENGKPGQARNIGMQYASGEYIGFMDDDDILEPDMYAFLYNIAKKHQCDLVTCLTAREEKFTPTDPASYSATLDEILTIQSIEERQQFLKKNTNMSSCNKIYRREMLLDNDIFFPTGMIYEDIFFSHLVKHYCQKVYLSKRVLYHHIINVTSISQNVNKMDRISYIQIYMLLIEELRKRGLYTPFEKWYEKEFIVTYITFITNYEKLFGTIEDEIFQIIKSSIWELFPNISEIPVVQKLSNNPSTSPKIRKALQLLLL